MRESATELFRPATVTTADLYSKTVASQSTRSAKPLQDGRSTPSSISDKHVRNGLGNDRPS